MKLLSLENIIRSIGRGVVLYAPRWSPGDGRALIQSGAGDAYALKHLGDTEGDITLALNEDVQALTLPEITGPAEHEADYMGENPVLSIPLFLADPTLRGIVSPISSPHGGGERRRPATKYTLAVLPEALVLEAGAGGRNSVKELTCPGGAWELDGVPLDAARSTMLAQSVWLWRGYFKRPEQSFKGGAGNAKKSIEKCTFQVMHHPDLPDGQHLYTAGDPFLAGVDLNGGS